MHEQDFSGTKRLYYDDSFMRDFAATVISCEPDPKGGYDIVLDATAFFPEGGGQQGDEGALTLPGGQVLNVTATTEKSGIIIHHADGPVEPGAAVLGQLNWAVRFDRMQQHSGEHIVSGLVHQRYGFTNVGFRLAEDKTTLDFDGVLTAPQLAVIESLANEATRRDVEVVTFFPTKEEEKSIEYRSKLDIAGQVRLVEIPGYDLCACCAPHVKHSYEIGPIKVTEAVNYKGGTRVTILCGTRAMADYGARQDICRHLGQMLSVPEAQVIGRVEALKQDLQTESYEILNWQRKYLEQLEPEIYADKVLVITERLDTDVVRNYINARLDAGGPDGSSQIIAVFTAAPSGGYNYLMASKTVDLRESCKTMNQALSGRGGGKPGMVQGSVTADAENIREYFTQQKGSHAPGAVSAALRKGSHAPGAVSAAD